MRTISSSGAAVSAASLACAMAVLASGCSSSSDSKSAVDPTAAAEKIADAKSAFDSSFTISDTNQPAPKAPPSGQVTATYDPAQCQVLVEQPLGSIHGFLAVSATTGLAVSVTATTVSAAPDVTALKSALSSCSEVKVNGLNQTTITITSPATGAPTGAQISFDQVAKTTVPGGDAASSASATSTNSSLAWIGSTLVVVSATPTSATPVSSNIPSRAFTAATTAIAGA